MSGSVTMLMASWKAGSKGSPAGIDDPHARAFERVEQQLEGQLDPLGHGLAGVRGGRGLDGPLEAVDGGQQGRDEALERELARVLRLPARAATGILRLRLGS